MVNAPKRETQDVDIIPKMLMVDSTPPDIKVDPIQEKTFDVERSCLEKDVEVAISSFEKKQMVDEQKRLLDQVFCFLAEIIADIRVDYTNNFNTLITVKFLMSSTGAS